MGLFSDERIFVLDIDALQEIVKYPDTRNLLDASVRLRRILTDSGEPLLHKVGRGRDFKPRFKIAVEREDNPYGRPEEFLGEKLLHMWSNPDPSGFPNVSTKEVGLDDFLRSRRHYTRGTEISVKEMINYVANVSLHPICTVTIAALLPLYQRIRA